MKSFYKILFCVIFVGALSSCATSHNDTTFGQAKANFEQEDYQSAFHNIQGPAKAGNAEAEYALGYMFYYGKGTPINREKGKEWILKAAQAGNKNAQEAYQMILAREQQVMPAHTNTQQISAMKTSPQEVMAKPTLKTPSKKVMAKPVLKTSSPKITAKPMVKSKKVKPAMHHMMTKPASLTTHGKQYTLQLLVTSKASDASAFIKKHRLGKNAQYIHRKLQGKDTYTVIYGHYASPQAARLAIKTLPKAVQALKPWVRRFTSIQKQAHK